MQHRGSTRRPMEAWRLGVRRSCVVDGEQLALLLQVGRSLELVAERGVELRNQPPTARDHVPYHADVTCLVISCDVHASEAGKIEKEGDGGTNGRTHCGRPHR